MCKKLFMTLTTIMMVLSISIIANAKEYRTAAELNVVYDVPDINSVNPNDTVSGTIILAATDDLNMLRYKIIELISCEYIGETTNTFTNIFEKQVVKIGFKLKINSLPASMTIHYVTETKRISAAGYKTFTIGKNK